MLKAIECGLPRHTHVQNCTRNGHVVRIRERILTAPCLSVHSRVGSSRLPARSQQPSSAVFELLSSFTTKSMFQNHDTLHYNSVQGEILEHEPDGLFAAPMAHRMLQQSQYSSWKFSWSAPYQFPEVRLGRRSAYGQQPSPFGSQLPKRPFKKRDLSNH